MKLITCPINGTRPVSEFVYGGELRLISDPQALDDQTWAEQVFYRNGAPGIKKEWWCHVPSNTWFIAERNTATDETLNTYLYGEEDSR
ncbi:MAG: sarcosine oxidase subunit delta [Myxacorys chilensis ATA2-1-KO14]|jgi:sarcosine oxidase subunit delta|nr:sarcosine oxidase subunit delta [Myxacorys chilensis ATA2-1-KO14]